MRLALLISLLGLAACQPPPRVRLVSFTGAEAPALAAKLGLFRNVEFQETAGTAKAMEALLAGSADAIVGTYEQALQLQAQGKDIVALRLLTECHCLALVASPRSSVRTLRDLGGKVIGVGAPGGSMQTFATRLLEDRGAAPASYAAIGLGATAFAALEGGKVDAGVVLASTLVPLRQRYPNLVVLAETFSPQGSIDAFGFATYPAMALLTRRDWLSAHPAAAKQLAASLGEAVAWIRSHSAEEVRDKLGTGGDLEALRLHLPRYSQSGAIDPAHARVVLELLERGGKVPKGRVRVESTLAIQ